MVPTTFLFFAIALLSPTSNCQEYIPGTPGAPWTVDEIATVKSKLFAIFGNGGYEAVRELNGGTNPDPGPNWTDVPNSAKMLRLGFHDCLKYTDGTGGCDGCLNWEGVGFRFEDAPNKFQYENVGFTNNNGLKFTVEVLEGIYTNPAFPRLAPALNVSLRDSGKSRADLWAFAAIAAVEWGLETHNQVCDGTFNENPGKQCYHKIGEPDCHMVPSRPIVFETGRADCTEFGDQPYKATKEEVHPNAVGNGKMTADFFEENFGFTGRETVAIMGAHTMGRLHVQVSLFRYLWTTREQLMFNNGYYRNIVRERKASWFNKNCVMNYDAEGRLPLTRWMVHTRKDTKNGGPVHWIHENYQCPSKCVNQNLGQEDDPCCDNGQCVADSVDIEDDPNINQGCEKFKFISGLDEMALPCEIGLYFDFEVTEDGVPYGCPGLERFTPEQWNQSYANTWSMVQRPASNNQWVRHDPMCGPNTLEYPPGSTPLHQIFEEYAADQNKWLEEFIPAFEKMLRNGYPQFNPASPLPELSCNRIGAHGYWRYVNCRGEENPAEQETFFIVSRLDGRAIEPIDGSPKMQTINFDNPNQRWFFSRWGNQIINVGTDQALGTGNGQAWRWIPEQKTIVETRMDQTLTRSWDQADNAGVFTYQFGSSAVQFWTLVPGGPIIGEPFKIVSLLDNRVIEGKVNGEGKMMTSNESPAQLWILQDVENGIKLINVHTRLPLFRGYNGFTDTWTYDDKQRLIEVGGQGKAMDRGWAQEDGNTVGVWEPTDNVNQKWLFEPVATATTTTTTQAPYCVFPIWQGDHWCDDENNVESCNWDGGDCCGDDVRTLYCNDCECLDPNFAGKAPPM